jgi:hypothetical protein
LSMIEVNMVKGGPIHNPWGFSRLYPFYCWCCKPNTAFLWSFSCIL